MKKEWLFLQAHNKFIEIDSWKKYSAKMGEIPHIFPFVFCGNKISFWNETKEIFYCYPIIKALISACFIRS